MSLASALGAIEYEAESSWGEDVTTFATHRLPTIGAIDTSGLFHSKVDADRTRQYRHNGSTYILMTQGGSFKIKMDLPGHGLTTAGTPSVQPHETFLARVFGGGGFSATSSTTLTGGTAASPTTTASGTFESGGLCRVGALGDGDGDGQFYAISTHSATTLSLVGALNGAPVNGAVLYPVYMVYPIEDATGGDVRTTGMRFRLLTANLRYECHGCWPMSVSITGLSPGERPQIEVTVGVSWWRYTTATFPSTLASTQYNPAPIAAGSLNVQDVGTTTRNTRNFRSLTLDHTLGMEPLMGPGGVSSYQTIVGVVPTPDRIRITWTEDADTSTTTPVLPGYGTGTTMKHLEYTGSCTAGSAFGFKCPNVCITNVATQRSDGNVNRLTIEAEAYTGTTTTNNYTLAAIVYGLA